MVDLDTGLVHDVDLLRSSILARPELTPRDGAVPAPVPALDPAGATPIHDASTLVLDGPVTLLVDDGRVMAWDRLRAGYVALSDDHLVVLDAARSGACLADVADLAGPSARSAAADLGGLGLLRPERLVAADQSPSPTGIEPDASPHVTEAGSAASADPGESEGAAPAEVADAPAAGPGLRPASGRQDGRVPVIPLYRWGEVSDDQGFSHLVEPALSIGSLFASARAHRNGQLEERYDLHRLRADAEAVFAQWASDPVPAIFVFSDYIWNIEPHLRLSARVKEVSPESICIHGGPSMPKYEEDAARFFGDNPSVDVGARGEGEVTFIEFLEAIDGDLDPGWRDRLHGIAGLTFRLDDGSLARTEDRDRLTDLDVIPSPYLTGEFDDMLDVEWRCATIETNRGCPYGCTYCDWGSATLSRIRKFDLARVMAELDWIASHAGPQEMHIADANFGIFARDVEIADRVVELRKSMGAPYSLTVSLAKNTVKYSQQIITNLTRGGVSPITASSAVQTLDPHTLEVVARQNIKVEKYDELALTFQQEGIPLVTDLLMGLPGATVESFKGDLQHCFDREVTPRTMEILMLPNAPMNDPAYRAEHEIVVDDDGVIVGASSFTFEDYQQMRRIRLLFRACDHFGLLRQVLRFLQWDRGLPALDVIQAIESRVSERGNRYPLLAFVANTFDLYTVPPVGWDPFFDEVVEFLSERFGIELDDELATVIEVQKGILPARGRAFPARVELQFDWVAYVENHRASQRGRAIHQRLRRFGPSSFEVTDPGHICDRFVKRNHFPGRRSATTGNLFWVGYDWELASPLARRLATNVAYLDEALA